MASAKIVLEDIGENFLLCSICLEHFKEPKLLPCLHRFCSQCLDDFTLKHHDKLNCPVCQKKFIVPEGGFKTDFCVKNICEYVQLKQSLGTDKTRPCSGCSNELEVTAFCLKCHGFLCKSCHNLHETNNIAKDHRQHVIDLKDFESSNLTMERLASLKEAPKCTVHPEKISELCCIPCGNQPICMACGSFGKHKGHDLHEITSLAEKERVKLLDKTAFLHGMKEKVFEQRVVLADKKEQLDANMTTKKDKLSCTFELERQKIRKRLEIISENYRVKKAKLETDFQVKMSALKKELETEMEILTEEMKKEKEKLETNLKTAEESWTELLLECKTKQEANQRKIEELSDHFEKVIERYENIQSTVSSILAARHDWTDMQCIPDICLAIDVLIEDIGKEVPDSVSDIEVGSPVFLCVDDKKILSENAQRSFNLGSTIAEIDNITGNKDATIAVTGYNKEFKTIRIILVDSAGKIIKQIKEASNSQYCYCCFLSQFIVASAYRPRKVGIFDIRNGTFRETKIPGNSEVSCVAGDSAKNEIIVGSTENRDLYVFDNKLNFCHKLTLPETIMNPHHMAANGHHLLVCDQGGKGAFAVSMEKPPCEVLYEFKKPQGGENACTPRSVCVDSFGFTYILWGLPNTLVQYSRDGQQLLASRLLPGGAVRSITTVGEEDEEKVLIATDKKVITYSLVNG